MRTRPSVPSGRGGLLVLAVAAVPIVLSRCKPVAKKLGEKMVEWGEMLKKEGDRPEPTASEETSSKADMKEATTKEHLHTASPAGKEEVKEQIAAETAPKKTPPKPRATTKKKADPKPKAGTETNPKKPSKKS